MRRRPGSAYVATAAGPGRLVALEIGTGLAYLLALSDLRVDLYLDGSWHASLTTPWSEAQLRQIVWAQLDQSLLITHPEVPPQRLVRESDTAWSIAEWQFAELAPQLTLAPFARFAPSDIEMQASATTDTVTLTTSQPFFLAEHLGGTVRLKRKRVLLTNVQTSTQAVGLTLEDLVDTDPTKDWDELAFSDARGWPASVSFHQNRTVIGGSRDLPSTLWLSKTGDYFNFDLGDGLPDEAIAFRLAADDAPAIKAIMSGRHLQVFTSTGEWIITGAPLTPINIQVERQSRIGSPLDRHVPPRDVDGATLFAGRNGREIREFLFTDTEQAYQAADLALLARHLVSEPLDQDFDRTRRLFLIVMADGTLASIAIYRNAEIAAWSLHETKGRFLSVAMAGGQAMLLVDRENGVFVEQFDDDLMVDSGVRLSATDATQVWGGLDHLEGQTVAVVADNLVQEPAIVTGGQLILAEPARELTVGLPYRHVIEPLPAGLLANRGGGQDSVYRPVRVMLRLFETQSLRVDTGAGPKDLPLHRVGQGPKDRSPTPFTGDVAVRAMGWRRGSELPPWRVEQETPLPCTILSATTEVEVNV